MCTAIFHILMSTSLAIALSAVYSLRPRDSNRPHILILTCAYFSDTGAVILVQGLSLLSANYVQRQCSSYEQLPSVPRLTRRFVCGTAHELTHATLGSPSMPTLPL